MLTTVEHQRQDKLNNVIPFIPDGDFYFTKGVEAFQKRKFQVAVKWLKKAIESSPNEPLYQCQLSIIYTEIGSYHMANQILTEVLEAHGDHYVDCYYLIANNYAHLGLLTDAKKKIKLYLQKAPDGDFVEEANELLSVIDIENDQDDDLGDDWMLDEEDELLIYQETVFFHLERQEWDKAIALLEEMRVMFPDHPQSKHEYSFALFFSGKQDEAIQYELQWLKEDPQSLFCQSNLAVFYHEQNRPEQALVHIESLKNVYPIHEQQKLKIATTLARTGHYHEAYDRFKILPKAKLTGHVSYYKWFSVAAFQVGNQDEATSLWEEGKQKHQFLKKEVHPWLQ
ncbi:tetratricopeptide repeat protein [Aquibacillus sediminis]|uniref:tetratricopeptide repeat protein n=1 Tax=Aquibacillus sediminis TaxID=2574734 RepID=UPI001107DAC7|nr:tetratricopeptide repeat protein [Aquibacillus sediminis]